MRLISRSMEKRMKAEAAARWVSAGHEPAMVSLLADPIVRLLLRSDGLTPKDLNLTVARVRAGLVARRRAGSKS